MVETKWWFKGREFTNCNCAYGCPCQFNALPTYGDCKAVIGVQINEGVHGETRLGGLRFAGVFACLDPFISETGKRFRSLTDALAKHSAERSFAS